jgi:hypothetical protein
MSPVPNPQHNPSHEQHMYVCVSQQGPTATAAAGVTPPDPQPPQQQQTLAKNTSKSINIIFRTKQPPPEAAAHWQDMLLNSAPSEAMRHTLQGAIQFLSPVLLTSLSAIPPYSWSHAKRTALTQTHRQLLYACWEATHTCAAAAATTVLQLRRRRLPAAIQSLPLQLLL